MVENYKARIARVNELLLANEPRNITVDEHSGYSGYKPQYIIDALNEVFELGEWGFEEISNHIEAGDKGGMAIAQVQVWLKGIDFKPTGWGQNRVTRGDTGDALKAAQTDAIKKALSYYSIGNRAYLGLLPKDKPNNQQPRANAPVQRPQAPQAAKPQPTTQEPTPMVKPLKVRITDTYNRGGKAGIYANSVEFQQFIKDALGLDAPIAPMTMNEAQYADVDAAITRRIEQMKQAS